MYPIMKPETKTITEYLDEDYREYAMYVVEERAIPSVIDGFKPTQRKVVYSASLTWKTGNEKPMRVFQLTGKATLEAKYHHGEAGMNGAIVSMAQRFKNSMPVLEDIGQFGSLRAPEPSAARYISTKLHKNFRLLYMDFDLLTPKFAEGQEIEPRYFLPIVPTVLLNGSSGIAVGFATNVLNRHPIDLIDCCLKELDGKKFKDPTPYYVGFKGPISNDPENPNSWLFSGIYEVVNTTTVKITELPPSMTYEKFNSHLASLEDAGRITGYENNCKKDISYTVKFRREDLRNLQETGRLTKFLKLDERDSDNFTVLDENGELKIFASASEIIKYFVAFRLSYYDKRKAHLIAKLTQEASVLSNRARFIKMIIEGKIKVNNVPKKNIIDQLELAKFDKVNDSFTYLMSMAIHTLTKENYEELLKEEGDKLTELDLIKKRLPIDLYREDLTELKKAVLKTSKEK